MTNGINPQHLTPKERMDEVSSILAAGIIRLRLKESKNTNNNRNLSLNSLDVSRVLSLNETDAEDRRITSNQPQRKEIQDET